MGANVVAYINWQLNPAFLTKHCMTSLNHVREGRWYSIVTATFSHSKFWHLPYNMLLLYLLSNRAFSGRLVSLPIVAAASFRILQQLQAGCPDGCCELTLLTMLPESCTSQQVIFLYLVGGAVGSATSLFQQYLRLPSLRSTDIPSFGLSPCHILAAPYLAGISPPCTHCWLCDLAPQFISGPFMFG